jgi:hypothetical protein
MRHLMNEFICYGGMAATRGEAYSHALDVCVANARVKFGMTPHEAEREGRKAADRFAFLPPALQPDEVRQRLRFDPTTGGPLPPEKDRAP